MALLKINGKELQRVGGFRIPQERAYSEITFDLHGDEVEELQMLNVSDARVSVFAQLGGLTFEADEFGFVDFNITMRDELDADIRLRSKMRWAVKKAAPAA